jgi:antitoxin component YwqK of YwqJK toxin-antitoxin module
MRNLKRRPMKQVTTLGLFLFFLMSCGQTKLSDIEIIKFDPKTITDLKQTSDTIYTEHIGRTDFYTADYFVNRKDSIITKLFKDSIGNVVAYNKTKNDKVFFAIEYFPNGQARGKLPEKTNGEYNGQVRYYYEDGRVKSEGQFKKGLWSGEWKNYDKDGHLISIDDYGDGNVNPIKTTKIE